MSNFKLVDAFRKAGIVFHGPVTLRAGLVSEYYVDVKKVYGDPELLEMTARAFAETLDDAATFVAASGYGGIALGTAVSLQTGKPFAMVRDTEKNHGRRGLIDGYVPSSDDTGVVVDDVFTTGSSLRSTINILGGFSIGVSECGVVVARADTSDFPYDVKYLMTPEEIA